MTFTSRARAIIEEQNCGASDLVKCLKLFISQFLLFSKCLINSRSERRPIYIISIFGKFKISLYSFRKLSTKYESFSFRYVFRLLDKFIHTVLYE